MQIKARGATREHTLKTSVVVVLFGYSKGARTVSGKCIKPFQKSPEYSEGVVKDQAVNHLRDYYSWITSHRQAQFLADLYLS